jgi:hypothetical protein
MEHRIFSTIEATSAARDKTESFSFQMELTRLNGAIVDTVTLLYVASGLVFPPCGKV